MDVIDSVVAMGPLVIYTALFVLVFAESVAWLGLVVPGDLALVSAGALTITGTVDLGMVVAVAFAGTAAGYAVAYEIGRRAGPRLVASVAARPRVAHDIAVAQRTLAQRGTLLIVASRWVGVLCALVPVLAGASEIPRRRFTRAQLAGAALWVGVVPLLGRLAAAGVADATAWLPWISLAVAGVISVVTWLAWRRVAGRPVSRVAVGVGLGVVLGITTAVVMVRIAGVTEVVRTIAALQWWAVALVLVLQALALAALTQLWRTVFGAHGGAVSFRDALTICLGAFGLTQVLPGGGAAGGVFAIGRFRAHGADPVRATTTVLTVGLVSMGTLGAVLSLATTMTALASPVYTRYAVVCVAATTVTVAVLVALRWLMGNAAARGWLADRLARLTWRGRQIAVPWAKGLADGDLGGLGRPSQLWRPVGWSALNWTFDIGVLVLLLHAVGARAPLLGVLVAFAVGNLLNALPVTPGGIGLVEAGLTGTLIGFGVDAAAASVAVLAYRAIAYWLPAAVAAPVVLSGLHATRMAPVKAAR